MAFPYSIQLCLCTKTHLGTVFNFSDMHVILATPVAAEDEITFARYFLAEALAVYFKRLLKYLEHAHHYFHLKAQVWTILIS